MIEINPHQPEYPKINKAVQILRNGGVIVYPTDTIYGFGCDIFNKEAVKKIYEIKRKKVSGFSFICPNLNEIAKYAQVGDTAFRTMKKLLPGAYTFVFKATKFVPKELIPDKKTVAIRIPDNKICLNLVEKLGNPIITTSVNITKEPYFSDPITIEQEFGNQVDLIIDGGVLANEPSTVIDFTEDIAKIIRKGKGETSFFE